MLNYNLYIKLDSPNNPTDHLDSDGYFEVESENGIMLGEAMIDKMQVYRKEWQEIIVKNKPYNYKSDQSNSYKLYDLILTYDPDTTFYCKLVQGSETTYGYFGQVDCEVNEDRSIIRIQPAILDQYTDFIENNDTDIDIFGDAELIENGEFKVWTNGVPEGWPLTSGNDDIEKINLLDKNWCALGISSDAYDVFINNLITVNGGSPLLINFKYIFLTNVTYEEWPVTGGFTYRAELKYKITLLTSGSDYQLQSDGSWLETTIAQPITYASNKLPIKQSEVTEYDTYSLVTDPLPEDGVISVMFYNDLEKDSYNIVVRKILLTDITIQSSSVPYIELKLNADESGIVNKNTSQIQRIDTTYYPFWFIANPLADEAKDLFDYFDTNNNPNWTLLADSNHGVHDEQYNRYPDLKLIFETDEKSPFYKAEMTQLTMYKGSNWRGSIFERWRKHIKGLAIFSREEYWKSDEYYTAQDELDGLGNEGDLKPPQESAGWVNTDTVTKGKRLWVRTPFNGTYTGTEWVIDDAIDTTQGRLENFDYFEKLTSKINYPISENSRTIATGITFRDLCRKIYRSTHNSLTNKEVYSAFFWNDSPYLTELDIPDGYNYYDAHINRLNNIAVVHTTDLKPDVEINADETKIRISFKDFWDDLKNKFPELIWFIDSDKNLHIEHTKFIDMTEDFVNILTSEYGYVGEYATYDFDKEELFGTVKHMEINSGYEDFKDSTISFDKIVSNKRNRDLKKENQARLISTDIQYAIENANNLENGIILVAYENNGTENVIKYGTGQKTSTTVINGDLSISSLLSDYARYEGVWNYGKINNKDVNFKYTKKVRKGKDFVLKGIRAENFFLTSLGIASATKKTFDFDNETTTVTPIYRHNDYFLVMNENDFIEM